MSKAQEILNKTIGNPMQGFLPLVKKLITSRQNCRSVSAFHFSHQNHCSGHSGHCGEIWRDSFSENHSFGFLRTCSKDRFLC